MKPTVEDNQRHLAEEGYEHVGYLKDLLAAAHRQADAAREAAREIYGRYQAATQAQWDRITDEQIMAEDDRLRRDLVRLADRESWAAERFRRLGPKSPLGRLSLHDEGQGPEVRWVPTFEFYTLERDPSAEDEAQTAEAIRELGAKWAMDRRLIKLSFMLPDRGTIGEDVWIEYEPATEQGRVMTKCSRYADAEQLAYGPVEALVSAAVDHVELLKGLSDDGR